MSDKMTDEQLAAMLVFEFRRAQRKHPQPFINMHHGYAVLLEEVDELWDEVKAGDKIKAHDEVIQVGAMALRFLHDLDLLGGPGK